MFSNTLPPVVHIFIFIYFSCLSVYLSVSYYFIILFNYKERDNKNKKITIYYVVWTRLTRVCCFNWLAHYKRMRIADKNNVHCTF